MPSGYLELNHFKEFGAAGTMMKGHSHVASQSKGLADRYALALYELADDQKALDDVAADLAGLRRLISESGDFVRLIRSPVLSREEQTKAVAAICDKAGSHALTAKFLGVLAQNRRLFALADIITAYLEELARRRGEVAAEVTAAISLSEDEIAAVTDALRKTVGRKVTVDLSVDPSLIGGLVVRVGSRMFDSSLRTKLQRLQFAMKGVG